MGKDMDWLVLFNIVRSIRTKEPEEIKICVLWATAGINHLKVGANKVGQSTQRIRPPLFLEPTSVKIIFKKFSGLKDLIPADQIMAATYP